MRRNKEKVPGFDEIIFENRNKEYGAYKIRNSYNATTAWSVAGGTILFVSLVIWLSAMSEKNLTANSRDPIIVVLNTDPDLADLNRLKPKEPEKPLVITGQRLIGPPVVTSDTLEVTTMLSNDEMLDSIFNKPVDQIDTIAVFHDPSSAVEPEPEVIVQEMPVFPGGEEALMKFIHDNIRYPEEAAANGIEGRVTLRFAVMADGSIKREQIIRGVHPVLDQEAIRVIGLMPKWKPGRQNGKPVPVWFSVPVNFRLTRN